MAKSSKLRELRLKREILERLLPRLKSERNKQRMRLEISIVTKQIKRLLCETDEPSLMQSPVPQPEPDCIQ
jgi:hypothetical protein